MKFRILILVLGLGWPLVPGVASAHIQLLSPKPRHPGSNPPLKQAPCGVTGEKRSTIVNTFKPGQMITVMWDEFIPHPGHFRIAFLADGDTFPEPKSYTDILKPEAPPIVADGLFQHNAGGRKTYQMQIQLPNVECASCTLQVIQVMTDKAPYTVGGDDVYHECADIVLSAAAPSDGGAPPPDAASPGTGGSGGGGGTGGAGTGGAGGTGTGGTGGGGTGGASGTGGGTGGTPTGGTSGSGGSGTGGGAGSGAPGTGGSAPPATSSGGCAVGGRASGAWPALVSLSLLACRRRRRSRSGGRV